MKHHLNTLFVTTQGASLRKDGQNVVVRVEGNTALRVPMHQIGGIVMFGRVYASPFLLGACAEAGICVSMFTDHGRFLAVIHGFSPGNVLLRRQQYRHADDPDESLRIARPIVAAKIANLRTVLLRGARDRQDPQPQESLRLAADRLATGGESAMNASSLDTLRGIEGESSATYFNSFSSLIASDDPAFRWTQRSRRPPLDPVNALLSFLYTLLAHDYRSACEAVGLDAAVGFLHRDRPGRPSLALDLMEALRPILADRVALSLINRQQLKANDFTTLRSGAVILADAPRKTVLTTYQKRKQYTLMHPFLNEQVHLGLVPHLQARLLARYIRGDYDAYPEFVWR
jgi:CRISPR-associated protein Cas1